MANTASQTARAVPTASLLVPIYNVERYLRECLESAAAQTLQNIEVICINDGSTDGSLKTMLEHAARDSRYRVIDKPNQGYGATMNRGIEEATGEWIAILEPDDWIEPDMYADLLSAASMYQGRIDIVKSPYWRIGFADTPQQMKINCSYRGRIKPSSQPFAIEEAAHLLAHHPSIWSAIYRKGFLDEKKIRFREYPGAGWADNPFLVETLCQTDRILYVDKPFYCYREETAEKAESFAKRSTLLPMERWQDMADVLDRIGVTDEGIWRAHNSRGFTYLQGVIEVVGLNAPGVTEAARAMFQRMDKELVFSDPEISPGCKKLYARVLGIECPKTSYAHYAKKLVDEGLYSLGNTGLKCTLKATTGYFKRRRARIGK